jgi:anti-sigma regulatory factor (Ser/Thr protein kinase)
MRWELRGCLGAADLSLNETEDLVLAVSEAANNAVEHALDPREPFFDVSADIDGAAVTIVVQDHGQWRRPTSDTGRGRGLPIMRALADTTVTPRPHGTTVTIRNHRAGAEALLVRPGEREDLARALVSLLLDPEAARRLGARGRSLAASRSHERLVDRVTQLYADVARVRAG